MEVYIWFYRITQISRPSNKGRLKPECPSFDKFLSFEIITSVERCKVIGQWTVLQLSNRLNKNKNQSTIHSLWV